MDIKNFVTKYGITSSNQLIDLAKELKINLKFIGLTNQLQSINDAGASSRSTRGVHPGAPRGLNPINSGSYIINIGNESGTHWTCGFIKDKEMFYFDSYAVGPEDDLIDILNTNSKVTKVFYNNDFQFQGIEEQLCGIYCILFLYHMQNSKKKSLVDRFNEFKSKFKDLD
jgi:hypothetical protein